MEPVEETMYFFCVAVRFLSQQVPPKEKRKTCHLRAHFGQQESIIKTFTNVLCQYLNMENSMRHTEMKPGL